MFLKLKIMENTVARGTVYTEGKLHNIIPVKILRNHLTVAMSHLAKGASL